jgi:hypothetical protein
MTLWMDATTSGRHLLTRAALLPGNLRNIWTSRGKLLFSVDVGQKPRELVLTVGGQLAEHVPSGASKNATSR